MCGDALLVAPIVRAGGEVEIALPPGALVRPQHAPALRRPAGAALSRQARPVSGVRPRRLRAAARPRRPAHRRDRRRQRRSSCCGCSASRRTRSTGFAQVRDRGRRRRTLRRARRAERQGRRRSATRCRRRRSRRSAAMPAQPPLAITSGEPAGIGPELLRDARRAPRASAVRRRGSSSSAIARCSRRARRASACAPRYADFDPGRARARRRRGRNLASAARRAGRARARPIPTNARSVLAHARSTRLRRLRDRRVRRARHAPVQKSVMHGRRHSRSRATPSSSPSARTRRAS